jgi:protease-4
MLNLQFAMFHNPWGTAMNKYWLLTLSCLFTAGCFNGFTIVPTHLEGPLEETIVEEPSRGWTRQKIALIDVSGLIMNAHKPGLLSDGENPCSVFRERLKSAADDPDVKAVVLRINSPGGGVTASDMMYRDLENFRQRTGKPVVACMMDVAASGGYYLAMGCDTVYAHPGTVTGSIGVIMSLYNAEGLATKLGIESNPVKSGPNKDLMNPARKMTDEERRILQGIVDQFYSQFVAVVADGRRLPPERVREIADGRIYSATEAKQLGLIDQIGYLDDAIADAKARAGVPHAKVVAYDRTAGARGSIYAATPHFPSEINVKLNVPGLTPPLAGAQFMYLWQPGE